MSARGAFGVLARAIGLYLAATSGLALFSLLWESAGRFDAGPALTRLLAVIVGVLLLLQGDSLARRVYRGDSGD